MTLNEHLSYILKEAEFYLQRNDLANTRNFIRAFYSVWDTMTEVERIDYKEKCPKEFARIERLRERVKGGDSMLDIFDSH
jgi:hypothetical protein